MVEISHGTRARVSIGLFLGAYSLVIAQGLGYERAPVEPEWILIAYLLLEATNLPRFSAIVGSVYLLLGLAIAAGSADYTGIGPHLLLAAHFTLPLLLLFGAMACIQCSVTDSEHTQTMIESLARSSPWQRFIVYAGGGHVLGGVLSLAGLKLMASGSNSGSRDHARRADILSLLRGFSAAACWSPFFVGMAMALTAVSADWISVAGYGVALSMLLLLVAGAWDRVREAARGIGPAGACHTYENIGATRYVKWVIAIGTAYLIPALVLYEAGDTPIVVAVATTVPIVSLIYAVHGNESKTGFAKKVVDRIPNLRGELFVLFAANVFAVGILSYERQIEHVLTNGIYATLPGSSALVALIIVGTIAAAVGIHPLVTITLVAGLFPAGIEGVAREMTALALTVVWALGTMVSPVSAVNLMLSPAVGMSPPMLAWRWNGGYCAVSAILVAGVLYAMARWTV